MWEDEDDEEAKDDLEKALEKYNVRKGVSGAGIRVRVGVGGLG